MELPAFKLYSLLLIAGMILSVLSQKFFVGNTFLLYIRELLGMEKSAKNLRLLTFYSVNYQNLPASHRKLNTGANWARVSLRQQAPQEQN